MDKDQGNNIPVVEIDGISKQFPGVQALSDVHFQIEKGEIHGLVGKNGAGKSTLMSILMGLIHPNSGFIKIGDKKFENLNSQLAMEMGIAYVPQRIHTMSSLSIAENILAGDMPTDKLGFILWKEVYKDAKERLDRLNLDLDVYKNVEGLTVAEKTMLAISKALFSNAKLVILDEPTSALPRPEINRLFDFIKQMKSKGVSFIYISHHLEEVFEICDSVTVLKNGEVVITKKVDKLTPQELTTLLVGEDIKDYERTKKKNGKSNPMLELHGVTRRGHYEDIDLSILEGEVIGMVGLEGCGAASLGKGLFGLERLGIGEVVLDNRKFLGGSPKQAFRQGLAYLPQDRYLLGIVGIRTLKENITYSILDQLRNLLNVINEKRENKIVNSFIDKLGIVTPSPNQIIGFLSGGNQQKAIFAKLAATKPKVLILHEPTQGIDVQAKIDIYKIIDDLSQAGVSILIISNEILELIGVCDRIVVMFDGKIHKIFSTSDGNTTPEVILQELEGGKNYANF